MQRDNNRLLLELEKHRREINRETIHPSMCTVDVDTLLPIVKICAKARASYIECLTALSNNNNESGPTAKQIDQLKQFRITYEELVRAANALETIIDRGYVDAKES